MGSGSATLVGLGEARTGVGGLGLGGARTGSYASAGVSGLQVASGIGSSFGSVTTGAGSASCIIGDDGLAGAGVATIGASLDETARVAGLQGGGGMIG